MRGLSSATVALVVKVMFDVASAAPNAAEHFLRLIEVMLTSLLIFYFLRSYFSVFYVYVDVQHHDAAEIAAVQQCIDVEVLMRKYHQHYHQIHHCDYQQQQQEEDEECVVSLLDCCVLLILVSQGGTYRSRAFTVASQWFAAAQFPFTQCAYILSHLMENDSWRRCCDPMWRVLFHLLTSLSMSSFCIDSAGDAVEGWTAIAVRLRQYDDGDYDDDVADAHDQRSASASSTSSQAVRLFEHVRRLYEAVPVLRDTMLSNLLRAVFASTRTIDDYETVMTKTSSIAATPPTTTATSMPTARGAAYRELRVPEGAHDDASAPSNGKTDNHMTISIGARSNMGKYQMKGKLCGRCKAVQEVTLRLHHERLRAMQCAAALEHMTRSFDDATLCRDTASTVLTRFLDGMRQATRGSGCQLVLPPRPVLGRLDANNVDDDCGENENDVIMMMLLMIMMVIDVTRV